MPICQIRRQTAALGFLMLATALTPTPAETQTTNDFDGTYAGVSRKRITQGGRGPQCEAEGVPESLIISNGVISSAGGGYDGSVNPQGLAVIRTPRGSRIMLRSLKAPSAAATMAQAVRTAAGVPIRMFGRSSLDQTDPLPGDRQDRIARAWIRSQ